MEVIKQISELDKWGTIYLDDLLRDDLKMDGLDILDVALTVENEFGIFIHDDEADNWKTVEDIIDLIKKKKGILS